MPYRKNSSATLSLRNTDSRNFGIMMCGMENVIEYTRELYTDDGGDKEYTQVARYTLA